MLTNVCLNFFGELVTILNERAKFINLERPLVQHFLQAVVFFHFFLQHVLEMLRFLSCRVDLDCAHLDLRVLLIEQLANYSIKRQLESLLRLYELC